MSVTRCGHENHCMKDSEFKRLPHRVGDLIVASRGARVSEGYKPDVTVVDSDGRLRFILERKDSADLGTVTKRLAAAGYDRGASVTPQMADRLQSLHEAIAAGTLGRALSFLEKGQDAKAEVELCGIKGIGKVVFRNFVALLRG